MAKKVTREILEIVLAFAVAWGGYQLLAAATGTPLPIVAVVSDSMYHDGAHAQWWDGQHLFYESRGIPERTFLNFPFRNGLAKGDLLLVVKAQPKVGDVVIYQEPTRGISIVHRVIAESGTTYIIKGDNNAVSDQPVKQDQLLGKVVFSVPLIGYPRFLLFAFGI